MSNKSELIYVGQRTKKITKWNKFKPMKEWFEENIILNKGAVRGKFRSDTAPHLNRMFEELDKSHVNIITLKVSSQTQKTTVGLGALMKWIDQDYHDLFFMIPNASNIRKFLSFKISPMIEGCPSVKAKLEDYRQDEKERKHSHFYATAQNLFAVISTNDSKSITTKYGVMDEAAEFPPGIISETLERMKEYGGDFKALITSTQIRENDEINHYYNISEVKAQYFLHCPHCEGHFYPLPEHLKFMTLEEYKEKIGYGDDDLPYDRIMSDYKPIASRGAYLVCPICEAHITNKERVDSILGGKCKWFQVEATQKAEGSLVWEVVKTPKEYYESVGLDLNTVLAPRVPIKKLAEKEIECRYASPHMKETLYDKFYVGYWNRLYQPEDKGKVSKNDILLLSNKLNRLEVHKDTNALHLGVDLQKNRLYFVLLGVRYGEGMIADVVNHGELYSGGIGLDFQELEEIIEGEYFDADGNVHKVVSCGIDIRGFSLNDNSIENVTRSQEALNFIFDYRQKLESYGVVNSDDFIFPMLGHPTLTDKTKDYAVKLRPMERKIDGALETKKLKELHFSNFRVKSQLFSMIERGIKKAKAKDGDSGYSYDRNLLYINEDIVRDAAARESLPREQRMTKHAFESHLTSEHLTYKILPNGSLAKEQSYEKKYQGIRNDYLDCCNMAIVQSLHLVTYRTARPNETLENEAYDVLSSMFG